MNDMGEERESGNRAVNFSPTMSVEYRPNAFSGPTVTVYVEGFMHINITEDGGVLFAEAGSDAPPKTHHLRNESSGI